MRVFSRTPEGLSERSSLNGEFQHLISGVERVIKEIQQLTGERLSAARSELESNVTRAKAALSEAGHNAADTASRAKGAMEDYVAEKPWPALAVAIAVGAVVAVLLTRRSRRGRR